MNSASRLLSTFTHLDKHIAWLIHQFGPWSYIIIFLLLFAETGFVITPFLPGDTLLFVAGFFASPAKGALNPFILVPVLILGPLAGDITNFHIGKWLGPKLFHNEKSKFFNRAHLQRTHDFFETYGSRTIILARWVPIVRTFAPFVAGLGRLTFDKFIMYSIIGAVIWVLVCTSSGYFFGNLPIVKNNFEWAMVGMIAVTLTPVLIEGFRHRLKAKKSART